MSFVNSWEGVSSAPSQVGPRIWKGFIFRWRVGSHGRFSWDGMAWEPGRYLTNSSAGGLVRPLGAMVMARTVSRLFKGTASDPV